MKKQRFCEYYRDARDKALSLRNIRAGFKAAGIIPLNPQKVLSSPFVLPDPDKALPQRPTTPEPQTAHNQVISTPKSRRDLYRAMVAIDAVVPLPRVVRDLLAKTGRTIDRLVFRAATTERQLIMYKRLVNEWKAKSKKQAPVDPNKQFVQIEDIKRAHNRVREQSTATRATTKRSAPVRTPQVDASAPVDPFLTVAQRLQSINRM
jgi:hypothetical protein